MSDKRKDWLAGLNEGDEVGVDHAPFSTPSVETVARITPTGRIVTTNNHGFLSTFRPDGSAIQQGFAARIVPMTPGLRDRVVAGDICTAIQDATFTIADHVSKGGETNLDLLRKTLAYIEAVKDLTLSKNEGPGSGDAGEVTRGR